MVIIMSVEKISTGIDGLDELLNGGIPKKNSVLISGQAGAGKTTFCSQFLHHGLEQGENCMFVTFEETPEQIKEEAKLFGWDFDKYDSDRFTIKSKDPFMKSNEEMFWFRDELEKKDIDRLALDSTSILSLYHENPYEIRKNLYQMITTIKETDTTSILTTESPDGEKISRYDITQYVTDGVIMLYFMGVGEKGYRSLQVRKMRKSDISTKTVSFNITDSGIKVGDHVL